MKKLSKFLIISSVFIGSFITPIQAIITTQEPNAESTGKKITLLEQKINIEVEPLIAKAEGGGLKEPEIEGSYFGCSWWNLPCWILELVYILAVPVGNFLAGLAGMVLDFFLLHSISSTSYRSGFIEAGWEILRDLTNIVFLFALLILAFQTVLGKANKKGLVNIVLIALTINFSLFMSYLIIDTSNILAHVFYNKINESEVTLVPDTGLDSTNVIQEASITQESRSLAIANKINPQKLTNILKARPNASMLLKFVVALVAGIINYTMIGVFLSISLLMLGRTIGLYINSVLSPLAFASIVIPNMRGKKYIGFDVWIKDIASLAFMAPVFLFFMYLTIKFINIGLPGYSATDNIYIQLLNVLIPMMAVLVLIKTSKTVSKNMAGEIGGMVANTVSKTLGTIGKVALGGAAIAATVGVGAAALGARAAGGAVSAGGRAFGSAKAEAIGRRTSTIGKSLQSTKLDLTKIPGFSKIAGNDITNKVGKFTGKSVRGNLQTLRDVKWEGIENMAEADLKAKYERDQRKESAAEDKEEYGTKYDKAETEAKEAHEKWQEEAGIARATRQGDRARKEAEADLQRQLSEAQAEADGVQLSPEQKQSFKENLAALEQINKNIEKLDKEAKEETFNKRTDQDILKTSEKRLKEIKDEIGKEPTAPRDGFKTKAEEDSFNKRHNEWKTRRDANQGEIDTLQNTINEKEKSIKESNDKLEEIKTKKDDANKEKDRLKEERKTISNEYTTATLKVEEIKQKIQEVGSEAEQQKRQEYARSVSKGEKEKTTQQHRTANAVRDGKKPTGPVAEELQKLVEEMQKNPPANEN